MRACLLVANWKMHGLEEDAQKIVSAYADVCALKSPEIIFALPATLLAVVAKKGAQHIHLAGQDCHAKPKGAYTGDISGEQLKDAGASSVILGHSERRHGHGESDMMVSEKALAGVRAGLVPIICIGETKDQRVQGQTFETLSAQIEASFPKEMTRFVLAYEPVWAIGSGQTPSMADIGEAHDFIRQKLEAHFNPTIAAATPLLYGGSVGAHNAADIFRQKNVDGALVGGASLRVDDFMPIIDALKDELARRG